MPDTPVLPPKASDGVLTVTASSIIDAPIEKVWEVLLDFSSYPEWNAFVRTQTIMDANDKPHPSQTVQEGSLMYLTVHLPPSLEPRRSPGTTRLVVTLFDPEAHRVAWRTRMPTWLMVSDRWQWLTVEDGKTKYETVEVFRGPLAYLVKWFVGANLRLGFQAMADGLKDRAEALHRA